VIARGEVLVDGAPAAKASRLVAPGESLTVVGPPPRFVGRGGEKLAAALDRTGIDLTRRRVLDVGSSTGGFTDCALQAGAASVVAVDVGRGQLHQRLRDDPRVEVHERTNIRHVKPGELGEPADAVVVDVSFISLRAVLDPILGLLRPGADLVLLVKPQFEAGRQEASKAGGVITDPEIWSRVLTEVGDALEERRVTIIDLMTSPLRGADGNVEFLLHARAPGVPHGSDAPSPGPGGRPLAELVHDVLAEVAAP
jgi:23S rRNA (cytidine1920-2'-O)/16S rRNA (cytidine1409-2'-O)-methyltransferase